MFFTFQTKSMFSQKIRLDQKVIQVTLRTYVLENSMLFVNKWY